MQAAVAAVEVTADLLQEGLAAAVAVVKAVDSLLANQVIPAHKVIDHLLEIFGAVNQAEQTQAVVAVELLTFPVLKEAASAVRA